MNKYPLLILSLFVTLLTQAQTTNLIVKESEEFREQVPTDEIVGMLTVKNKERGIVKFSKKHITTDVFSDELKPLTTSTIEKDRKELHLNTFYAGSQIQFLTEFWPKRKKRELNLYTFNVTENKIAKKLILNSNIENPKKGIFSRNNSYNKKSVSSSNGKYLAIVLDDFRADANSYTVTVFDTSSNEIAFSKELVEDAEKFYDLTDITVDNNANVFLIKKLYKTGKRERKKGEANYIFRLSRITKQDVTEQELDTQGYFVNALSFGLPKDELSLLGFYGVTNAFNLKGICSYTINKEKLTTIDVKFDELPIDVYKDLYGDEKGEESKGKELGKSFLKASDGTFYIDHVFEDNQGNNYLIAEEFYITTHTTQMGMNGGMMTTTTYHYDDILVIKYNNKGTLEWGRSIYKRATSPSYNAFVKKEKLHLILNSGKNLIEKQDGRTKVSKGWFESSSLYDIVFDENGEVSYNKVQDNKGKNYYLPASGTFSEGEFIMVDKRSNIEPYRRLMLLE